MKIGIITYHRAHNYGAVLQCYALSRKLSMLGHKVEVIDYYPTYFKAQYTSFSKENMKRMSLRAKLSYIANLILTSSTRRKRAAVFNNFISKLPLSNAQYTESNYNFNKYDAIFFGSDQVWNPLLTFGDDKVFSGDFNKQGGKFISYAASSSPKVYTQEYEKYFKGIIERFNSISVREKSLNDYINNIKPQTSEVVLDPVLLLDRDNWGQLAVKPSIEDYLLIYTVPQSPKVRELATLIAKEKGLKIIEIRPTVSRTTSSDALQTVSPEEFLGYFKYASYVVTTSFHGTAFSVKFQKQFATLKLGTSADDRATNLLSSIGLTDRMVAHNNLTIPQNEIDYTTVEQKLNVLIDSSVNFIEKSIDKNE